MRLHAHDGRMASRGFTQKNNRPVAPTRPGGLRAVISKSHGHEEDKMVWLEHTPKGVEPTSNRPKPPPKESLDPKNRWPRPSDASIRTSKRPLL